MFVTVPLGERRPLFGRVVCERVELSEAGEIAKRDLLEAANNFYGFITLRFHEIMPDHAHVRFTWPAGHGGALQKISG